MIGVISVAKITIKELAKLAGVSQTAVSFILNGKPGVSEQTRRKVLEIIEQTNYKADRNSQRLALQKSFNICLAYLETSSPFDDLFYFEVAKGMLSKNNEFGYNIVLCKIEVENNNYRLPDVITSRDTDGVIIFQDINPQILFDIESYGIPCVVVDSHMDVGQISSVSHDAEKYTYEGVKYLLEQQHTQIGIISSSYIPDFWVQCFSGFTKAMSERGLLINPAWVQSTATNEDSSYQCMERILGAGSMPTGVFCGGDIFAIGAIRCLRDHGMRVPADVSIMGVDNIILGRYIDPPLTTIDLNKIEMGEIAIDLLIRKIEGAPCQSVVLNTAGVIRRGSVGVPRRI